MRSSLLGLVLPLLLAASGALAEPIVYHSPGNTGQRPEIAPYLPKASAVTLYLWLDPGPTQTSGSVCVNATGDASCGYDLRIQVYGDPKLEGFSASGNVVYHPNPLVHASLLRANRLETASPLVGPRPIGQLVVDTSGPLGGSIEVTGMHSIGAGRQLLNLPANTLAYVPEPGELVLLTSGLAGLALLHRLRGGS